MQESSEGGEIAGKMYHSKAVIPPGPKKRCLKKVSLRENHWIYSTSRVAPLTAGKTLLLRAKVTASSDYSLPLMGYFTLTCGLIVEIDG